MTQKDISIEYGLPTRDILLAVQKLMFPMPIRVIGEKCWFRRSEIARYFKDGEAGGGQAS
jgi:hypothetical protein